jgi:hypothetical protein
MYLKVFREIVTAEIRDMVDCPANFVTLDAPDRAWVDRCLTFAKGLRIWHETNCVAFGKRWRENDQGLLTIFVPEFHWKTELWHIHMIQEIHPLLTYGMYKVLWLDLWGKEKEQRRWERRGIEKRDINRPEWPKRPVDVRPYDPAYHSWYITKQATWCYMPFDSFGVFRNLSRLSLKRLSHVNLKKAFAKEVERLKAKPSLAGSVVPWRPQGV